MTGLNRCMKVIAGEKPDCVPVVPENYQFCIRHSGYRMKDVVRKGKLLADCLMQTCEDFDYDGITVDLDNAASAEVLGCGVAFRDDEPAVVSTPAIGDLSEVRRLRQVRYGRDSGRWSVYIECMERLVELVGREKLIIVYCATRDLSAWRQSRVVSKAFLSKYPSTHHRTPYGSFSDTPPTSPSSSRNCLPTKGLMWSYSVIRWRAATLFRRKYTVGVRSRTKKRLLKRLRSAGFTRECTICGDVTPILSGICNTGLTVLEIDYKCDLQKVREVAAGGIVVRGTLDPSAILRFGTPESVRAETARVIDILGTAGRLLISSGCDMSPDTPPENMMAMVEAAHAHRYG